MFCRFNLYEPVEFISRHLMDKLEWSKVRDNVAIHVPCSSKKMGIEAAFNAVAQKCSHEITSSDVPCCGKPKLSSSLCVVIDSSADHIAGMQKSACVWLAFIDAVKRGTFLQLLHACMYLMQANSTSLLSLPTIQHVTRGA